MKGDGGVNQTINFLEKIRNFEQIKEKGDLN